MDEKNKDNKEEEDGDDEDEEVDEEDDLSFVESLNIRLGKEYCKDDEKENLETHLKADDAFIGDDDIDATEKTFVRSTLEPIRSCVLYFPFAITIH